MNYGRGAWGQMPKFCAPRYAISVRKFSQKSLRQDAQKLVGVVRKSLFSLKRAFFAKIGGRDAQLSYAHLGAEIL